VQPENQSKYAKLFTDFLTSSDFSTAEKDANIFTILENRTNNNTALDASTKRYLATKINSFKEDPMKYEQKYTAELMKYMPNLYLAALKEDIEKTVKAELEKLVLINGGKVDLSDIKVSPDGKIYTFKATLKEMPDEAKNLNGLALDLQVQRLFENQKTLMQITKVIYPAEHSGIKLEANQQYLFLNGLQAFEIKGALANKTRTPVKQEQLFYTYDKEKTEERIRENLSQKSFSFEYDKSAFTKNKLPLTMGDVDIDALFEQIKLDKEVKTEDGKQFSRQLRFVDGTTYKNIPEGKITWDFDTEKVTLKPNESTLKTINLFGKDFTITIENDEKNGVKIKMDSAESTKLSEWMATIWESHIDVLTETNTGDSKEYENLKKSEYKRTKEDVQRPRYNTQSTQLSLARGVVVNVTNAQKGKEFFVALAPDGSSTPIE
jgi:hypothetical protein